MSSAVTSNHPPIAVVITVILLLFFFFGIFCVYFCRCFLANVMTNWHFRRSPSGAIVTGATNANINPPPPPTFGLHPDKIQALPAFKYSDVKGFRRHNYGLECAICLTEFRDDDLLRLLTTCCHVFHQDCIDLWFESHSTCPVCRSDLDVPDHEETLITRSPILLNNSEGSYHHININDHDDDEVMMMMKKRIIIGERSCLDNEEIRMVKFSRSNTTGHSLITRKEQDEQMIMGDDDVDDQKDKYRLRLRDNVKINIIRRHNYAVSCITFGDFSSSCTTTTTTTSDCSNMMNGSAGLGLMGDQLSASSSSKTSSSSLIKEADHNRIDVVVLG